MEVEKKDEPTPKDKTTTEKPIDLSGVKLPVALSFLHHP